MNWKNDFYSIKSRVGSYASAHLRTSSNFLRTGRKRKNLEHWWERDVSLCWAHKKIDNLKQLFLKPQNFLFIPNFYWLPWPSECIFIGRILIRECCRLLCIDKYHILVHALCTKLKKQRGGMLSVIPPDISMNYLIELDHSICKKS